MGNAGVSANNIKRLERRLQKKAEKRSDDEMSVISDYSVAHSVAGSNVSRGSRMGRSRSASAIAPQKPMLPQLDTVKEMDWTKLDEYAAYLHEQDALRQKAGVLA